ncbi:multidrug resistance-associated ABC transporter [Mycena albidolilacea]|uniref:Multidrug resistance-associated ABC transporter n=1 Tax=Mycena albidolilacea TaxID=1033008 RepID=A0AAD6ZF97_9AGAR|nr:multidrug resistance-associated ABC transporter [Mycena albidolilacea]
MRFSNPFDPPPAHAGFGTGKTVPESSASYLGQVIVSWLDPFFQVGFSRPLEKEDLWELPGSRLTSNTTDALEASYYPRCPPEVRPKAYREKSNELVAQTVAPSSVQSVHEKMGDLASEGSYDSSLFRAVLRTFHWHTLKTTTPLLTKVILTWLTESYIIYHATEAEKASGLLPKPRGIGYGIGLACVLFVMQAMRTVGLSVRTGIIGSVFRKSLRLSARARLEHTVGQTTTIISTDSLGYPALVGLGVIILSFPLQAIVVTIMFSQRKKGVKITDTRVRLSNEVLQGIRLIKYYASESFYMHRISTLREREIATVRKSGLALSALIALVALTPVLATVLSFITYALTGHDLNVAIIFSSLQLFNSIQAPLTLLPIVLSALADAIVAFGRIGAFLTAEELPEQYLIDADRKDAVDVDGASFTWELAAAEPQGKSEVEPTPRTKGKAKGKEKEKETGTELPTTTTATSEKTLVEGTTPTPHEEEKPFELRNLKFSVPKAAFVAIVGKVGSGKSSILQGLIGEMRRTAGRVVFGGTMAYVPQTAWIRNATLRQNIVFGQEEDEEKFRQIIRACNLEHDLEVLPHGEETEIGERGINLSGGQKARISLARAAYASTDIVLLDDPLSAVDFYVGKAILEDCIVHGPLADRTRILVTHALHVLDKTDYIYVMDNGTIKEQGTYETLMKEGVVFSQLMEEYGNLDHAPEHASTGKGVKAAMVAHEEKIAETAPALMQIEERNTGAVTFETYGKYLKHAGTLAIGNSLFLGFWTSSSIRGFHQGDYMAVYAGLAFGHALFVSLTSFAFTLAGLTASLSLFKNALAHVLGSPLSFFDTTPMGRILSRLVKDQDALDADLPTTLMALMTVSTSVIGTVGLVFYTFPLLGIIFAPLAILYYLVSTYYRRSSVETKRLDSLMRSALPETLTGLATIRAYREQEPAIKSAEHSLDLENRAYFMTITLQLWLALRLDFFGNILIFGIALFAAGFRNTVNPSRIGVVLSYALTNRLAQIVAFFAENEQNMNSVERLIAYAELPGEGAAATPEDPPNSWPDCGEIVFKNVNMSYREGLPLVLKGVTFTMRPGEKVGIVGRTGAGKSSLVQALFRMVELQTGEVTIDGYNTRNIGLDVLRHSLALVPQDSVLFLGTLRENLDPQATKTDAELISVLQRAWLLPREGDPLNSTADSKFSLDSIIGDEGSNYSAGEKQLLALCRALDEATSSVDVETDAKLQRTIRTEFAASTLLCIAHRLNTIAYYDRIVVMDQGEVAEFDTVLGLYDKEDSIFRSLCNEANLQRADILRIRVENVIETELSH